MFIRHFREKVTAQDHRPENETLQKKSDIHNNTDGSDSGALS